MKKVVLVALAAFGMAGICYLASVQAQEMPGSDLTMNSDMTMNEDAILNTTTETDTSSGGTLAN